MAAITLTDAQEWVGELADRLSPSTVSGVVRTLSMVLNAAVDDGIVDRSVTARLKLHAVPPTVAQVPALEVVRAVQAELPGNLTAIVDVLLGTGCRISEATG